MLDELMVASEEALDLIFLTGGLECLLDCLRNSFYRLVSVLPSLFLLVSRGGFRRDSDDHNVVS